MVDHRVEEIVRASIANRKLAVNGTPDVAELERHVTQLLGESWLDQQVALYRDWALANSDPVLVAKTLPLLPDLNYLVPMVWSTRFWLNEPTGWPGPPTGAVRLAEVAVNLAMVEVLGSDLFNSTARKHWSDRLRDSNGGWAVIHEATDFAHFTREGVQAIPRFLTPASREEIVLRLRRGDFPVECKAIRPGTGRTVKAEDFKRFSDIVIAELARADLRWSVRVAFDGTVGVETLGLIFGHVRRRIIGRHSGMMQLDHSGQLLTIELGRLPPTIVTEQTMARLAEDYDFHLVMIATEPNAEGGSPMHQLLSVSLTSLRHKLMSVHKSNRVGLE